MMSILIEDLFFSGSFSLTSKLTYASNEISVDVSDIDFPRMYGLYLIAHLRDEVLVLYKVFTQVLDFKISFLVNWMFSERTNLLSQTSLISKSVWMQFL